MQVTPATMYDTMSAGPATSLAAAPVATKMPAPMTAPMPSAVSVTGPSTRRSRCSPAISSSSTFNDLVANSWFLAMTLPRALWTIHDEGDRPVVDQFHVHHRPEPPRLRRDALRPHRPDELLVQGHRD